MKKYAGFIFSSALVISALACLILSPATAAESVRRGLDLCAGTIIPSLLPFFVISALIAALGIPQLLGRWLEKPMAALFGVSGVCCAPFILGLTGGYPVGASAVADLVRHGDISPDEGERLLPFCNNTGPAFIIGCAGSGVFASARCGLVLYASHVAAAVAVGVIFSLGRKKGALAAAISVFRAHSLAETLSSGVKSAVTSTLNVCGFVVFFSVVTGMLESTGVFSALSGSMAAKMGLELSFCRSLLTGILELGSGIASMYGLSATPLNLALASFILGFGGLSVHCQTVAVVEGAEMKCARHFAGRIVHGALSALFTFVFAHILIA